MQINISFLLVALGILLCSLSSQTLLSGQLTVKPINSCVCDITELKNIYNDLEQAQQTEINIKNRLEKYLAGCEATVTTVSTSQTSSVARGMARSCADLYKTYGIKTDGVYQINPSGVSGKQIEAYCDMTTAGGGWTVFQRRRDGSENFNRNWADYKNGFGSVFGEFWLGNDVINILTTSNKTQKLRVEASNCNNLTKYEEYFNFLVDDEKAGYKLTLGASSGTLGDGGEAFSKHSGSMFSTPDVKNDLSDPGSESSCAIKYSCGWWFKYCIYVNLNGIYYGDCRQVGDGITSCHGIRWYTFQTPPCSSLKTSEMKLRPNDF